MTEPLTLACPICGARLVLTIQHYGATPPAKPPQPTRPDPSVQEKRR